jgi:hypothetical protein
MQEHSNVRANHLKPEEDDASFVEIEFDGADDFEELIQFPTDGSNIEVVFWILLFPLRLLMHFTLPDVRSLDERGEPTATIAKAFFATVMCLVWLVFGSYTMVASLEALASLMDIPDSVIGFTVSAAGKILETVVASTEQSTNSLPHSFVALQAHLSQITLLQKLLPKMGSEIRQCPMPLVPTLSISWLV